jgi:hypothetical protein
MISATSPWEVVREHCAGERLHVLGPHVVRAIE